MLKFFKHKPLIINLRPHNVNAKTSRKRWRNIISIALTIIISLEGLTAAYCLVTQLELKQNLQLIKKETVLVAKKNASFKQDTELSTLHRFSWLKKSWKQFRLLLAQISLLEKNIHPPLIIQQAYFGINGATLTIEAPSNTALQKLVKVLKNHRTIKNADVESITKDGDFFEAFISIGFNPNMQNKEKPDKEHK